MSEIKHIPVPNCNEVLDMIVAITTVNDTEANRYYDGEMSVDFYLSICASHMSEIVRVTNHCRKPTSRTELIEFWTRHKNFAEWGLIQPRSDSYTFLDK